MRDLSAMELCQSSSLIAEWSKGVGVVRHSDETILKLNETCKRLGLSFEFVVPLLKAADIVCNQAMWLVAHMTYAKEVLLDGTPLRLEQFKRDPQGHTGGSLNMVPAYVGFLTANAITGERRDWLMGQGHCVAAIDAVNLLLGRSSQAHLNRYALNNEGLTRFVRDFYSYRIMNGGLPESPIGSHVNAHTAGATIEGGYLGFAGLQYVHQPLPEEKLVAFLSDGAFEEQRGSDWSPRWWRAEDCGLVAPIMIANGRRIDQRTTSQQLGGADYFIKHLKLHGFEPNVFDGRDPGAFALEILSQEASLKHSAELIKAGELKYPVKLPYGIAETEKGYGFYGAGTNPAHGTPLPGNPSKDEEARDLFNLSAKALFIDEPVWRRAAGVLNNHAASGQEKEHDSSNQLSPIKVQLPNLSFQDTASIDSPTAALDRYFSELVSLNPELRARVGNPDELSSNRFIETLKKLKHRVTEPEVGVDEALDGAVITALNEEAVISAVLANRKGLNIAVSYEAFAVKMLGALRQSIIFSRHKKELGQPLTWLSVPVIATSHLWENGKNEQSHQDSTFCEAMNSEMSDVSRVVFPADSNSAVAAIHQCYSSHGAIYTVVAPKAKIGHQLTGSQAITLAEEGAIRLVGSGREDIQLIAVGAYQLIEAYKIANRLRDSGHAFSLVYILEPGRFRCGRDELERSYVSNKMEVIFGSPNQRLFLVHGRPEHFLGVLRPLDLGPKHCSALGYINRGGTLDTEGLLFANKSTWAHGLLALETLNSEIAGILTEEERNAAKGIGNPYDVISEPRR
ncbi:xylulose 5-phosphate 3-epimerase [Litoribacillus peritrichatus]|uniref:Phosphoketolase n=1 Tax=Litoribacillus peritrichatus TaxID=718191 RepID=A0ABP7MB66_9GAMM